MDSLITAAARALRAGDPLGALKRVALRDAPPALPLRGIAMAQLGECTRAKELLRSATRAFGPKEAVARVTLEQDGDRLNVAHARHLEIRRLLLLRRLDEAELTLADLDPSLFPPASRTAHELVLAGIDMRHVPTVALCSRNSASVGRSSEPENHERRLQLFSRRARCSASRTEKLSSCWNCSTRARVGGSFSRRAVGTNWRTD